MKPEMSEAELQQLLIDTAEFNGWLWHHETDSRRTNPGWPDLTVVRGRHILFLELKSKRGRVRPDQQMWLDALEQVDTVSSALVRPADADAVVQRLSRRS